MIQLRRKHNVSYQVLGKIFVPSTNSPHIQPVPPITSFFCASVPKEMKMCHINFGLGVSQSLVQLFIDWGSKAGWPTIARFPGSKHGSEAVSYLTVISKFSFFLFSHPLFLCCYTIMLLFRKRMPHHRWRTLK